MTTLDSRFADCPSSPNCVSSQANPTDDTHYIEPLVVGKSADESKTKLKAHLSSLPRVALIEEDGNYLHYVFTTALLRFKDDVEFMIEENGIIQVRSASRVGYSDLGANRKRVESIRSAIAEH